MVLLCVFMSVPGHARPELHVRTLSSRPDSISGGDVLVELRVPRGSDWSARLNSKDVTGIFQSGADSGVFIALLEQLNVGQNLLEISAGGQVGARVELRNHPKSGPIFSGRHQEPFVCQTEANGLGNELDRQCNVARVVQYYYKPRIATHGEGKDSTSAEENDAISLVPGLKPYNVDNNQASDVVQTTISNGRTVNFIVRREIGVINRGVYDIRFLHQPGEPLPTPWTPPMSGWNGRLVYIFGAGCSAGYRQGVLERPTETASLLLESGYAIVTSTLNNFSNGCNDRIAAETLSMVKEHFIEEYGMPLFTIGVGGSGGGIEQYLIAQNYPGLLDGIMPSSAFPDITTTIQSPIDCALLEQAFQASGLQWTDDQKTAVSGFATWRTCVPYWSSHKSWVDPRACDPVLDDNLIYNSSTNPQGVRCDIFNGAINIFGRNPRTGRAFRPLDNVGVQYGLVAFNGGKITAEQFIDLNERVGGYDEDGNITHDRMEADMEGVRIAYNRGLVLTGGGLNTIPIIDASWYTDDLADIHDRVRSLITRARLIATYGHADNQVVLLYPRPDIIPFMSPKGPGSYLAMLSERGRNLVQLMDLWLTNIAVDPRPGTQPERVVRNKPLDLVDGCWMSNGERIVEPATFPRAGRCNGEYVVHGNPRIATGAPLTNNIIKCELKPIRADDYLQPLSDEQLRRLGVVFKSGICDYSRVGKGYEMVSEAWRRF